MRVCGFFGVVGDISKFDHESLIETKKYFEHRGPDEFNVAQGFNFHMASARLAVIDPQNGHQPCVSNEKHVLVYNGEIFNRDEIVEKLSKYASPKSSDTDILYSFLIEHHETKIQDLEGQFAFAFWDQIDESLLIARDVNGEKPLYYYFSDKFAIFSSSAEAVHSVIHTEAEISSTNLASYLEFGYLNTNSSIYNDILQLPPGQVLKWNKKESAANSKSLIKKISSDNYSFHEMKENVERLDKIFMEVVNRQLLADTEVGVFLSGGLDSSLIAHYASLQNAHIQTFSINLPSQNDDHSRARVLSKFIGSRHHELLFDIGEFNKSLAIYQEKFDTPISDSGLLPLISLSKYAKQELSVALAGEGGDELFAGYPWSYQPFLTDSSRPLELEIELFLRKLVRKSRIKVGNTSQWNNRIRNIEIQKLNSSEKYSKYRTKDSYFNSAEVEYIGLKPTGFSVNFNGDFGVREAMLWDRENYLVGDLLVKADRASMSVGLELRLPFLSKSIIEFAEKLPMKQLIDDRQTKIILRELASKKMPSIGWQGAKFGLGLSEINISNYVNLDNELENMFRHKKLSTLGNKVDSEKFRELTFKNGRNKWMVFMLLKWLEIRI
jgi:asparagine synthase (glutamine-hydrolysing)